MPFLLVMAAMMVTRVRGYLREMREVEGESLLMRRAGEAEPAAAGEGAGLFH
jgi:hypothetical protein